MPDTGMLVMVPKYLSTVDAGYIALTAAEGGIGYWSVIESYQPSLWCDHSGSPHAVDGAFHFYRLRVTGDDGRPVTSGNKAKREFGGQPDEDGWYYITPRLIARGISIFLSGYRDFDDPHDWASMDVYEADAVIQCALFDEVLFS